MTGALSVDVTVDRGDFRVEAAFDVAPGDCLAVLGPNGAGKSTILSALAGLTRLQTGEVILDGRTLERDGGPRVPPEHRGVALLDQRPRLFPHLTVEKNLSFGPRAQGLRRAETRTIVDGWLHRLGLADRGRARPHELSGGQQQRIAIARAFASSPRVILLDEPFASLDAESGPIVRRILSEELARTGITAILVTHDLADAWRWADRCIVVDKGRIVDEGTPDEVTTRPRRAFTAALAGFGVLRGRWTGTALDVGAARLAGTPDQVGETHLVDGAAAIGIVAPRDIDLMPFRGGPGRLPVEVTSVSVQADVVRLETDAGVPIEQTLPEARVLGDGVLPAVGDRFDAVPRTMRVVPHPA